jgi:hypothetical protein
MPITNYQFENRIFFAKENGQISEDDAKTWSEQLKEATETSDLPIIALVDAMDVTAMHRAAQQIFAKSAHFDNLLAVVVATNSIASLQSRTIGFLGRRGCTRIFPSLEEARQDTKQILAQHQAAYK